MSDQAFTPMPTHCLHWKCEGVKLIRNEDGFMVCPNCQGSYGDER